MVTDSWRRYFVLTTLLMVFHSVIGYNPRPIIGIVSKPNNDTNPTHNFFSSDYVMWLEQSGARVVPILYDSSTDEIKELFSYVNGILFTGGGLSLAEGTKYFSTAQMIWNLAKDANDNGDFFPLWGTCMGFQLFSILGAQDHTVLIGPFDSYNLPLPLMMTPAASSSRIFGPNMPQRIWETLTTQPVTQNLHHAGVNPESYTNNQLLSQMFDVLSINVDRKGNPFASTIEGKKYPFYATQWHPERVQFDWGIHENLDKSPEAIEAIQYVSSFFVRESQKNQHKFPSVQAENSANIHNYPATYTGGGSVDLYPEEQNYYFKL